MQQDKFSNDLPVTSWPELFPPPKRYIEVVNIVKDFETETGKKRVLNNVTFKVGMQQRVAILGGNGAGKSTLIKILAGVYRQTSGHIHRGLSMSWPLALAGGFDGSLTGYDNVRFLSQLYDSPFQETFEFVTEFSELGRQMHLPVKYYSDGMRSRLAFALSIAISFECYLIDEVLLVGDRRFQTKCLYELFEKRRNCAMILAIHDSGAVKQYCTHAVVLKDGKSRVFTDLDMATSIYASL